MNPRMNYDPNLTQSGNMAKQTVRLTFGSWDYRAEVIVGVGGNTRGLSVIDCAVGNAYHGLPSGSDGMGSYDLPLLVLKSESGNELHCTDDDSRAEDWLKDMLIAAEIISIAPQEPIGSAAPWNTRMYRTTL